MKGAALQRREWLRGAAALGGGGGAIGAFGLARCANIGAPASKARVLVVGGGYGGATAAKYVRLMSGDSVDVVLVESNESFVSGPISNLVLGGSRTMADITVPYTALAKNHGLRVVKDMVAGIDPATRPRCSPRGRRSPTTS